MMGNWDGSWDLGDSTAMGLMMALFAAVLVGLTIAAVAWSTRSTSAPRTFEKPRETLDRRLAAGEIDQEQYTQARLLLEDRSARST